MLIALPQKEGHLPNLQDLPPISKAESKARIWSRRPHELWDVRFKSAKDWVPPPLPDFDTLLSSWFSYVICMMAPLSSDPLYRFWINFPYETETISIRDGGTKFRDPTKSKKKVSKKKKKAARKDVIVRGFDFITLLITLPRVQAPISVADPFILSKVGLLTMC
jgi:hypothetical protein